MSAITLTFRELSKKMDQHAAEHGIGAASLSNLHSALKAFLAANGLLADSVIGSILRACFYRNLNTHADFMKSEGRSGQYIANRKTLLGKWGSLVNQLDRLDAIANNTFTPFQLALRDIVAQANTTHSQLAKALGINKSTFRRWLNGAQPKRDALPTLRRIESFFAMEPGVLVAMAFERNYFKPADEPLAEKIEYRKRLAEATKAPIT